MLRFPRLCLPLAFLAVAACNDQSPSRSPRETSSPQAEAAAARQTEADAERTMTSDARIGALTNQVDHLEQSVADLQSTMDNRSTYDARINALETKVYAADPETSSAAASNAVPPSRPSK